jgi:hypothetical protein
MTTQWHPIFAHLQRPVYGNWLASAHPDLAREVAHMGRTKGKKFALDFRPLIQAVGWREIIRQAGVKSLIDAVGLKSLIDAAGLDRFVALLTPPAAQGGKAPPQGDPSHPGGARRGVGLKPRPSATPIDLPVHGLAVE